MKATTKYASLLSATTIALLALGASLPAAAADVDCNAPRHAGERKACELASQGAEPLRRYVELTRNIYAMYLPEFDKYVAASTVAKGDDGKVKVAAAK